MLQLVVAALLVTAAVGQWPSGQAPVDPACDRYAVAGGSNLMPHPVFCQMFYTCDANGNKFTMSCPNYDGTVISGINGVAGNPALTFQSLFAFGEGIGTCVYTGLGGTGKNICPYWSATNNDLAVQRKYPDVCCDRYWQVVAEGKFEQRSCAANQVFNMARGVCENTNAGRCVNQKFNGIDYCYGSIPRQQSNEEDSCQSTPLNQITEQNIYTPCKYRTTGFPGLRTCPAGTAFNPTTCACTDFNEACSFLPLTHAQLVFQKRPDSQCRASGEIDFSFVQQAVQNTLDVSQPRVYSRKTTEAGTQPVQVDHYFTHRGVRWEPNTAQAVFNGQGSYLYDYYYVDNPMHGPLAITMALKFDFSGNYYVQGQTYTLLENMYYSSGLDGSVRDTTTGQLLPNRQNQQDTKFCGQATISIRATYLGLISGQQTRRNFKFTFEAVGPRNPVYNANFNNQLNNARFGYDTGVKASTTTSLNSLGNAEIEIGDNSDQVRLVYIFNGAVSGRVSVTRSDGQLRTATSILSANNNDQNTPNQIGRTIGDRLGVNKCGFLIGRNFQGSINGFTVHEGCSNTNQLQPTG